MATNKKVPITIEDVYELIHCMNKNITEQIEEVKKDVHELSTKVDKDILEIKTKVQLLQSENITLKEYLKRTERQLKKNNIVVYGLEESEEETDRSLLSTVEKIITQKLTVNIQQYDIINTFRLGKKSSPGRPRPVLIEFHSSIIKKEVLKNRVKLKGTHIFVNEDLIEEDRKERKVLLEKLKEAKKEKKVLA